MTTLVSCYYREEEEEKLCVFIMDFIVESSRNLMFWHQRHGITKRQWAKNISMRNSTSVDSCHTEAPNLKKTCVEQHLLYIYSSVNNYTLWFYTRNHILSTSVPYIPWYFVFIFLVYISDHTTDFADRAQPSLNPLCHKCTKNTITTFLMSLIIQCVSFTLLSCTMMWL